MMNHQPSGNTLDEHVECTISAFCQVEEGFRTYVEDGVIYIYKNTHYDVVSTVFHCDDHDIELEVPSEKYEWRT